MGTGLETADLSYMAAPSSYDWRDHGAVTPVKNQGQCGSCWAFSTTGTVEGAIAMGTGNLVSMGEQNLMDCDSNNNACNGGNPYMALEYILQNGGIDTEADYPYQMARGYCKYSNSNSYAITGAKRVASGSESDLKRAVSMSPPQSPLMPPTTHSSCTRVVSMTSPAAPATVLTTVSWLLDMAPSLARTTGLSRTLGVAPGARLDTSRCPGESEPVRYCHHGLLCPGLNCTLL